MSSFIVRATERELLYHAIPICIPHPQDVHYGPISRSLTARKSAGGVLMLRRGGRLRPLVLLGISLILLATSAMFHQSASHPERRILNSLIYADVTFTGKVHGWLPNRTHGRFEGRELSHLFLELRCSSSGRPGMDPSDCSEGWMSTFNKCILTDDAQLLALPAQSDVTVTCTGPDADGSTCLGPCTLTMGATPTPP